MQLKHVIFQRAKTFKRIMQCLLDLHLDFLVLKQTERQSGQKLQQQVTAMWLHSFSKHVPIKEKNRKECNLYIMNTAHTAS